MDMEQLPKSNPRMAKLELTLLVGSTSVMATFYWKVGDQAEQSHALRLSADMLYDRVQEHLNNALRQVVNNLQHHTKEKK